MSRFSRGVSNDPAAVPLPDSAAEVSEVVSGGSSSGISVNNLLNARLDRLPRQGEGWAPNQTGPPLWRPTLIPREHNMRLPPLGDVSRTTKASPTPTSRQWRTGPRSDGGAGT